GQRGDSIVGSRARIDLTFVRSPATVWQSPRRDAVGRPGMMVIWTIAMGHQHLQGDREATMRYSVPAARAVQNGQELYVFFLPAKTLNALPIRVEQFDPDKPYDHPDQGYQRTAERNRARRFARYLETPDAVSPTALMLNDRDSQSKYDTKTGL